MNPNSGTVERLNLESDMNRVSVQRVGWHGVSFGSALAMAISFNLNQSLGWAILHGILSWFYVIYFAVFK
jgi:hypothetical protein